MHCVWFSKWGGFFTMHSFPNLVVGFFRDLWWKKSISYGKPCKCLPSVFLTAADDFQFPVLINMEFDTHGGEDVAMYARGPMSHLINGVQENQYIAHVMAYAACVGQNKGHCSGSDRYARSHDVTCAGGALSPIGTAILVTWAVLVGKVLQE